MLTEFQQRLARLILGASPDPQLALAGGAALIARELVDRGTVDLDLFTTRPNVDVLSERILPFLEERGLSVRREQVTPTFVRLTVSDGTEGCRLDIAQDARLMPAEPTPLGPMLAPEELAADKMLTLFARAEARDYVDVFALSGRFGKDRLLALAKEKDAGFDPAVFAEKLGAIDRLDRDEFDVDDATLDAVRAFTAGWLASLTG